MEGEVPEGEEREGRGFLGGRGEEPQVGDKIPEVRGGRKTRRWDPCGILLEVRGRGGRGR